MPTYTMTHNKTGEEKDLFCSYDECVKFLEENPDWSRVITAPALITQTGNTINKTSGDWKDLMKSVKKGAGRGNNIKT
jgi:hypothetical protein